MVVLDDNGLGKKIVENYKELDGRSEAVVVGTEQLKKSYEGIFEDADYRGVKEVFINPQSGWAEATAAVSAVIEAAVSSGVKCIPGDVAKLLFNENGGCTGVETKDGSTISASKIILSTGAGTAKILADSAPNRPNLQSEDRITAAAVITGVVKLSPSQMKRFGKAPIFVHPVGEVLGKTISSPVRKQY